MCLRGWNEGKLQFSHSVKQSVALHLVESLHKWKQGTVSPLCGFVFTCSQCTAVALVAQVGFFLPRQSLLVPLASP